MKELYTAYTDDFIRLVNEVNYNDIKTLINLIIDAYDNGKPVFVVGNGGSAASASHFQQDISVGALKNVPTEKRFKAICLNNSFVYITTIGNDISFEKVFVEQLKNYAEPCSLLIVITCSGNSKNIVECVNYAVDHEINVFGLLGFNGGEVLKKCHHHLVVKNNDFGLIEALHSYILHYIVTEINSIFKGRYAK